MFNLPPDAYISHATSGRFRIRVPSKKGDAAFFQSLKELGGNFPNIHEVSVNPVSGSILIKHSWIRRSCKNWPGPISPTGQTNRFPFFEYSPSGDGNIYSG